MNKQRRQRLNVVKNYIRETKDIIKEIQSEEERVYDNLPENLQNSNRGLDMEENIDILNEAIEKIDEVIDIIDNII